jgi:hypothetical protein
MAERRLVRAPSHAGTPLRHLDPDVPRTALSRLLSPDDDDGYLIVQLVVEGIDPALVARERGTSRPALVEQLRAAVEVLACEYEDVANAHLHENPAVSLRAALGGKRG